jgi:hypothetical protein
MPDTGASIQLSCSMPPALREDYTELVRRSGRVTEKDGVVGLAEMRED